MPGDTGRLPTVQARKAARVKPYINGSGGVLDFGYGDGELLANIPAPVRIGIEINPPSVAEARARGIEVVQSLSDVADGVATTVIASHSLEHVIDPAGTLAEFRRILAANSTLIIVLPAENSGVAKIPVGPSRPQQAPLQLDPAIDRKSRACERVSGRAMFPGGGWREPLCQLAARASGGAGAEAAGVGHPAPDDIICVAVKE